MLKALGELFAPRTLIPKQRYSWDCGITCMIMAIHHCGINININENELWLNLLNELNTKSIWTIDIFHVFNNRAMYVIFTTTSIGVDKSHESIDFYGGEDQNWTVDSKRVSDRFDSAIGEGLNVFNRSISNDLLVLMFESVILIG